MDLRVGEEEAEAVGRAGRELADVKTGLRLFVQAMLGANEFLYSF